ncbi:uncharacterized protein LOC128184331 [Crassostrea angulata]|uniref:uncharacterized protein LOC128184331 n=1 Tax=Magallana angulata TaxID=2784310 RepID=UPI0022B0B3F3|nr:uncharacterized protein LOC128184331 [Crassostrea angulata]
MNLWIILLFISLMDLDMVSTQECLPGYYGDQCNKTCRHPNYGHDCQLKCTCEVDQCDPITGCNGNNTTIVMPVENTPHFKQNITSANNSLEEGNNLTDMLLNCSFQKSKAMLISLCILAATFFVNMSIYLQINKKNNHKIKYIRHYREQNVNARNENSVL